MCRGAMGSGAQFFRRKCLNPWNSPQSTSTLVEPAVSRYFEPVTVPVAPRNVMSISTSHVSSVDSLARWAQSPVPRLADYNTRDLPKPLGAAKTLKNAPVSLSSVRDIRPESPTRLAPPLCSRHWVIHVLQAGLDHEPGQYRACADARHSTIKDPTQAAVAGRTAAPTPLRPRAG